MVILGIGGGLDLIHEKRYEFPTIMAHDAAAVLVDDGKVVAAIEEERLNRIKHTNKAPVNAMRFCLDSYHIQMRQVDKIAVYGSESYLNFTLKQGCLAKPAGPGFTDLKTLLQRLIKQEFDYDFDPGKIVFVPHHLAHAMSAFAMSGFDKSLILTIDGQGDGVSGMVLHGEGNAMRPIHTFSEADSLGFFYMEVIKFLGYNMFDEYKVMGLAPYGDPGKYRQLFRNMYSLLPEGKYAINFKNINLLFTVINPRRKGEEFTQIHKDIAASLQESLEEIVMHILKYFREKTGENNLCMAGGVAHNCSLNGKILYSEMFEKIFVQPAAHDAGAVIGAALYVSNMEKPLVGNQRLEQVYWGKDIGADSSIHETLKRWEGIINFEKAENIIERTARLLADGAVIGWCQGRSEFGPRALGNRSILADPRPAENKSIINEMVKKREGYRPFAPSVLEERADEFFDLTTTDKKFPFMVFVVNVRQEKQELLGAITHVDGTARIQTVSRDSNPKYWELINAFGLITGVPMLLNTSFNNNVEPIVDSVEDAVTCFLTTKLNYLVVGDYLITRGDLTYHKFSKMVISAPEYVTLRNIRKFNSAHAMTDIFEVGYNFDYQYNLNISPEMYEFLKRINGKKCLDELFTELGILDNNQTELFNQVIELWSKRVIQLRP